MYHSHSQRPPRSKAARKAKRYKGSTAGARISLGRADDKMQSKGASWEVWELLKVTGKKGCGAKGGRGTGHGRTHWQILTLPKLTNKSQNPSTAGVVCIMCSHCQTIF